MEARAMLRAAGLYCTAARLAVVDSLVQASGPIKPSTISAQLGTRYDRVTVYRTLDSLVHADLVHKVFIEDDLDTLGLGALAQQDRRLISELPDIDVAAE